MPDSWSKQTYVQGFYYESITLKKYGNMFEHIDISEYIYYGIVEPSYKQFTRSDATRVGLSSKNRR